MVRTYQDVFDELYVLDVPGSGSKILLALPRRQRIQRDDLTRRARAISKKKQLRFDLGELVTHGFRRAAEMNPVGSILTDRKPTATTSRQAAQQPYRPSP